MRTTAAPAFFLAVLLFCSIHLLFAATTTQADRGAQLADFAADLPSSVVITNDTIDETTVRYTADIEVTDDGSQDWQVHLISNENGTWKYARLLGVLQPQTTGRFSQVFEAKYSGQTSETTQYAVVAEGDVVLHGKYFKLTEDWSGYEQDSRKSLANAAVVFIPLAGVAIVFIIIMLAEWAYTSHSDGAYKEEYTVRTFFMPRLAGRPFLERVADILVHPLTWVIELASLAVMAGLIWNGLQSRLPVAHAMPIFIVSLLGAAIMPLIYFVLAWIYNQYVEKMPLRFMAGMFMWGIMAAVIALVLNTMQVALLGPIFGPGTMMMTIVSIALVAPFIEEFVKGLGLLALYGHHEFSDALHGLHLGFAVGLGFSLVENWFYLASKTDPFTSGLGVWVGLGIYRSVVNAVAHGCFSASLGASLGWAKSQKWGRIGILAFLPGVIIATVLHSLFNLTAIADSFQALSAQFPSFGFNPITTLALLVMLVIVSVGATMDYRRRRGARISGEMDKLAGE